MFQVTTAQTAQFQEDGYLLVESLYDAEEMDLLLRIGKADQEKAATVHAPKDAEGRESKLWLTADTERQDIYNACCHGHRMVDTMGKLLGDEVYLYHYKMMVKEPRVGGAWEWHQDYGYWYNNGCLYPDMASCMIAVDRASKQNGCLQVLKGSHKLGRLEHGQTGDQTGADMERMGVVLEHLQTVHCEMEPGTLLFFHSNLLHRSDPNQSDDSRWALICCYSAASNATFKPEVKAGQYERLERWSAEKVAEAVERHRGAL